MTWDAIKTVFLSKVQIPQTIDINEITICRRHKSSIIVLDLKSGAVIFVGEGKGSEALLPFRKGLKCSKAKIQAVAMDMSSAYISFVLKNLPKARVVIGYFHAIKKYNEKVNELRRKQYRKPTAAAQKRVLKGTRWLS